MSRKYVLLCIWVACSLLAAAMALQLTHSTYWDGVWHPVSNDSFYHARRILDAIDSPRGFYQFDAMIHAPEGSWLTWPWAYDWFMAKGVQLWLYFNPAADPMAIITHVAVYWIFVNALLLLGITILLELPTGLSAAVLLGFALSPLTQSLHGVGIIDHHYIEYSFVLLTIFTGLYWLKRPELWQRAVWLGITLGIAPAFHTGLFILQVPVLATIFILWLRSRLPAEDSMLALSCALPIATLAAVLPSEPFLLGQFQFSVLSWFHLYIAAVSTLVLATMARFAFSLKSLILLGLLGVALIIPIWRDTIGGAAFVSSNFMLLDSITEAYSPYKMIMLSPGLADTVGYYSVIGLLIPLLIPVYVYRGWTTGSATQLFFAAMVVFGTILLLFQYRLNYFGSFAIVTGWAVLLWQTIPALRNWPKLTGAAGVAIVSLAAIPSFIYIFSQTYSLGWDERYQESLPLLEALDEACQENPGIALVDNGFGHIVRYATACSVIANNFLMTQQHEEKIREMWQYLVMSPEELLENKPEDMRYVVARLANFLRRNEAGETVVVPREELAPMNLRLLYELNSRDDLPSRYRLIAELPLYIEEPIVTRTRIYEILPAEEATAQSAAPDAQN